MKVLVVGGSGFIRSHVVDRLLIYGIPCASSIAKRNGFALRVRAYCRTHGLSPIIVRALARGRRIPASRA